MKKSTLVLLLHSGLGGLFGGLLTTVYNGNNAVPLLVIWILYIASCVTGTVYGVISGEQNEI